MGKINTFIIGAPKSATSMLHFELSKYSDVYSFQRKEPNFFSSQNFLDKEELGQYNLSEIMNKIILDSSTSYSNIVDNKNIAYKIYKYNPCSKIIYIIRNPFDLIRSLYFQGLKNGHSTQKKYLNHDPMPKSLNKAVMEYRPLTSYCFYHTVYNEYLKFFRPEDIFLVSFDSLINNSGKVFNDLKSFLNISNKRKSKITTHKAVRNSAIINPYRYSSCYYLIKKFLQIFGLLDYIKRSNFVSLRHLFRVNIENEFFEKKTADFIYSKTNEELRKITKILGNDTEYRKFTLSYKPYE